jgi:hypothetical protein
VSLDAPVYNAVLQTAVDVETIATKLRRHRPDPEGKRFLQVIVFWWQPAASLSQKNLAQAWCRIMAKHAGMDHAEMWAAICTQLLGSVEIQDPFTGERKTTYRSSTTLRTRAEWAEFNEGLKRLAREFFDIKLPAGNDPQAWLAFRGQRRIATDMG